MAWSKRLKASLTLPSLDLTIKFKEPSSINTFSFAAILLRCLDNSIFDTLLKSNFLLFYNTVTGIFLISVVQNINFACSGGSSSVFNKALKAAVDSICTSSII